MAIRDAELVISNFLATVWTEYMPDTPGSETTFPFHQCTMPGQWLVPTLLLIRHMHQMHQVWHKTSNGGLNAPCTRHLLSVS